MHNVENKGNFEDFECLNEIWNGSLPANRLYKIGRIFVNIRAMEMIYISKDSKLQ